MKTLGQSKLQADQTWERAFSLLKESNSQAILSAIDLSNRIDQALMDEEHRLRSQEIYYSAEATLEDDKENKRINDYRLHVLKIVEELYKPK